MLAGRLLGLRTVELMISAGLAPYELGHGHCRCGQPLNLGGDRGDVIYCFGCGRSETDCGCPPFEDTPHDFGVNNWGPIAACLSCGLDTTHVCHRCDVHVCTSEDCRELHERVWFDCRRAESP